MDMFVVRGEKDGEPESYLLGVYATLEEAEARVNEIEQNNELNLVWVEDVEVGVSTFLSNR